MSKKFKGGTPIILLLIVILTSGLFFQLGKKQQKKENYMFSYLENTYGDNYKIEAFPLNNFVVYSTTSTKQGCGNGDSGNPFYNKFTPSLIIQNAENQKVKSIYEISFNDIGIDNKVDSSHVIKGDLIYPLEIRKQASLLVAEWGLNYCGSGGYESLVVFTEKDHSLIPTTGYPSRVTSENTSAKGLNITNKITGQKYTFPVSVNDTYSEVADLNNDGVQDLLFADWKWDLQNGESHYQPRHWRLQAFELVDGEFKVAKWWNHGSELMTKEKIGYSETDRESIKQIFKDNIN